MRMSELSVASRYHLAKNSYHPAFELGSNHMRRGKNEMRLVLGIAISAQYLPHYPSIFERVGLV